MDKTRALPLVGTYDIQFGGFDKLMPFRIREVLLVAAPFSRILSFF